MPRMEYMKEQNYTTGNDPDYGAIFMSNSYTRKECLRRGLFGLPYKQAEFVKQIKHGMALFLFDYDTRELHGVFQASSDGSINIVPDAFSSSGKQFPAQVKFIRIWHCRPLLENEFREAIRENYFSRHKFNFGLSEVQVHRLLTLFSPKKLERSSSMKAVVKELSRQWASGFTDAIDDNNSAIESGAEVECELASRGAPPEDCFAKSSKDCRLTSLYCFGGEPDLGQKYDTVTGNEQRGDASDDFRRLTTDNRVTRAKGSLVSEFFMDGNYGRDPFSLNTNIGVTENPRLAESGWSADEYHKKDEFTRIISNKYPSLWSNLNQSADHDRVSVETDPQVLVPRREDYTYPRFSGDSRRENTLPYDPSAPYFGTIGSSSRADSPDSASGQQFASHGGYVTHTLPLEKKVQPFSKHTATDFYLGDYVPLPSTHPDCPTSTSMIGIQQLPGEHSGANIVYGDYVSLNRMLPDYAATDSEAVSTNPFQNESRRGFSHRLPRPDFITSAEKVRDFKSSSMYPSFLHHLSSGDGVDSPPKDRVNASQGDFRSDVHDFNNRAGRVQDHVFGSPVKTESMRRKSVFSRLALPPKENDSLEVDESVDEVMAFLHDCQQHLSKQKKLGSHTRNLDAGGKSEMKKRNIRTAEIVENDDLLPPAETDQNEEEIMQQPIEKPHFIDFKRRSERCKSVTNQTQGCKDSPPRLKKRKLVRPKLVKDEPSAEMQKPVNPVENMSALNEDHHGED